MPAFIDLTGMTFGRLTVVSRSSTELGCTRWLCRCACGNSRVTFAKQLRDGRTKSCGCLRRETTAQRRTTHGHSSGEMSPTYVSWCSMIGRTNKTFLSKRKNKCYLGISVCERWRVFENFLADMGMRKEGTTLDRIDGTRGYEPGNCRWATKQEQSLNRSSVVFRDINDKRISIKTIARTLRMTESAVYYRFQKTGLIRARS